MYMWASGGTIGYDVYIRVMRISTRLDAVGFKDLLESQKFKDFQNPVVTEVQKYYSF